MMNVRVLATDYDGTLAEKGRVNEATIHAVEKLKHSGRRIVLVTGRLLDELIEVFPRIDLCDSVVAENGALLYNPATHQKRMLAAPVPLLLVEEMKLRGVTPIFTGDTIIATWRPHEDAVEEAIAELGLDWNITLNKEAVMVLPYGVDKASGLSAALAELDCSLENTAGVGDAENDIPFLVRCRCSAAVSNALDSVKARASFITRLARSAGVVELIEEILHDDLRSRCPRPPRTSEIPDTASRT